MTLPLTQKTDVLVVGAGPIGIELGIALKHAGIDCVQIEKGQVGQTISWYPRAGASIEETNVPGLYVAGTATAGSQRPHRMFIENAHEHVERIVAALTGRRLPGAAARPDRELES